MNEWMNECTFDGFQEGRWDQRPEFQAGEWTVARSSAAEEDQRVAGQSDTDFILYAMKL